LVLGRINYRINFKEKKSTSIMFMCNGFQVLAQSFDFDFSSDFIYIYII